MKLNGLMFVVWGIIIIMLYIVIIFIFLSYNADACDTGRIDSADTIVMIGIKSDMDNTYIIWTDSFNGEVQVWRYRIVNGLLEPVEQLNLKDYPIIKIYGGKE